MFYRKNRTSVEHFIRDWKEKNFFAIFDERDK